jgi:cellobiose-specific phosphotransferase system component IIB
VHQEGQKLIQMTLHDNRKTENIHVHINNPKADAIVIGNDNQVKMATKEVDQIRSKTNDSIDRIEDEVVYIRKQNDEILEQMKRMVRIITYLSLTRN